MISYIKPDWPVPANVQARFSTRQGGVSSAQYRSLNFADHVDDTIESVIANRQLAQSDMPGQPYWLEQVHGSRCVVVDGTQTDNRADASMTRGPGQVLAVMTADCLPILLATKSGDAVAVIHAGWRGLAEGVIPATFGSETGENWIAWMGPAIGPCHYEVGDDVRQRFSAETGFVAGRPGRWFMDLYQIAGAQLMKAGVGQVSGGGYCTYCDSGQFYSYRRDGQTGRMAGFIWFS